MEFSIKWIIIRRFIELIGIEFLLSFAMTALNIFGIVALGTKVFFWLLIGVIIFLCLNFIMLRKCFFDLDCDSLVYYVSNFAAHFMFSAVNILLCKFCPADVSTWIIAIAKFAKYSAYNISAMSSVLLFLGAGVFLILFAPIQFKQLTGNQQYRRM